MRNLKALVIASTLALPLTAFAAPDSKPAPAPAPTAPSAPSVGQTTPDAPSTPAPSKGKAHAGKSSKHKSVKKTKAPTP